MLVICDLSMQGSSASGIGALACFWHSALLLCGFNRPHHFCTQASTQAFFAQAMAAVVTHSKSGLFTFPSWMDSSKQIVANALTGEFVYVDRTAAMIAGNDYYWLAYTDAGKGCLRSHNSRAKVFI